MTVAAGHSAFKGTLPLVGRVPLLFMAYKTRTRNCSKCGKPITGPLPPTKDVQCLDCSIGAAAEAMIQMHNRSGPRYDAWLASGGNPSNRPPDYRGR